MKVNSTEAQVILKIDNVHKSFGDNHVLDGINFEVKDIKQEGKVRGQIRCILGPSGVGKSVLMRIITGLRGPDKGEVLIAPDGINLGPVQAGQVGIIAQDYPLFAHLTVIKNLVLAGKQAGLNSKEASEKAREMLQLFGLLEREKYWPSQLSGGQRQRVAMLQQVMVGRPFLLMDEPFSGLDPSAINDVITLIRELAGSDELNTMVIITHDIRSAVRISEKIHLLGRKLDKEGNKIRGAHFVENIDLLEMGIAWKDNIKELPDFNSLVNKIEDKFEII